MDVQCRPKLAISTLDAPHNRSPFYILMHARYTTDLLVLFTSSKRSGWPRCVHPEKNPSPPRGSSLNRGGRHPLSHKLNLSSRESPTLLTVPGESDVPPSRRRHRSLRFSVTPSADSPAAAGPVVSRRPLSLDFLLTRLSLLVDCPDWCDFSAPPASLCWFLSSRRRRESSRRS